MTWWEYILSQLTVEQWIYLIVGIGIYFYVFVNYLIRKQYFKVGYLDDGDGFDIFPCKILGNEVEFLPEKVKKLYGIIPLSRQQIKDPIRKSIAAGSKTMIKGPRTWKVYFATYNSPVTIDPAKLLNLTETSLSLGHDTIRGVLRDVGESGRANLKKDWLLLLLMLAAGMLLHMMLQKFLPI